jgi:glycosyltransferase involved in cell wall biosynthesis
VRHIGSTSFQEKKHPQVSHAVRVLAERHPGYMARVQEFATRDGTFPLRRKLDMARLEGAGGHPRMVLVTHHLGGGTERHVQELSEALQAAGTDIYTLRPSTRHAHKASLCHARVRFVSTVEAFDLEPGGHDLSAVLQALKIDRIHVHHLAGFQNGAVAWIPELTGKLRIPYDFTVHDYTAICPRITLIDETAMYCGEPAVATCDQCVRKNGSPFGKVAVAGWRARYRVFLAQADHVWVPNDDVSARLNRYFPEIRFRVQPHQEAPAPDPPPAPSCRAGETLRVAVIGAIGPHKGSAVLLACAKDAQHRALPLHFVVVGYSDNHADLAALANVTVTGPYRESERHALLQAQRCHLSFFPAVWPETYSYTLSTAFQARLMPVSFDLGAIANRIKARRFGSVMPFEWLRHPGKINDHLLSLRKDIPVQSTDAEIG